MSFHLNIKNLVFILNTSWILLSEFCTYCVFQNYSSFIDRVTHKLASINILYVKVFQAIALNNRIIDDKLNNKLLQFTDNAPWCADDIDYDTLIKLTRDYKLFFTCGFNPINSGMISLIFKANKIGQLEPIIIKMKRRNIETKLKDAVDNLLFFVNILSFFPIIKKYQISEAINKSIDMITSQTNFNKEVYNMCKMKENCKHLKYIKIPNVFQDVTVRYDNIIMMEYIDGLPINKIKEEDYENFAKQVIKFGFVTTMLHGFTHGDLHGGNVLFIKDEQEKVEKYKYKIGVLDFGIVYEINRQYKSVLLDIATDLFTLPSNVIAERMILSGIIEPIEILKKLPQKHYDNIIELTSKIVEDIVKNSKANQLQLYKFISKFHSYLNDNQITKLGLQPSDSFIKTQMCLAMSHGVTLTLCKDDYITVADKVLNELFHTDMLDE